MTENAPLSLWTENQGIDVALKLWVASAQSDRTRKIYWQAITEFRNRLLTTGRDLNGLPPGEDQIPHDQGPLLRDLSTAAQGWASYTREGKEVSNATYNQRLSILSSFYTFARKRQYLHLDNPIDLLERGDIQPYSGAKPLSRERVEQILRSIDRTTEAGKRDYALLLVFLSTGRRASEVVNLQWKHVNLEGKTATLHFEECKGGKEMFDTLGGRIWRALKDYLQSVISSDLTTLDKEQYLWISFSPKKYRHHLTLRGVADIFQKHLGTMKIHTTRHTFAHGMRKAGADTRTIQKRLGHASELTTELYLEELESAENMYIESLLDYYGVEDE